MSDNEKTDITAEFETITPEVATAYLRHNTRNRSVSARSVLKIASDIMAGRWVMNGDPIRFGADGLLYDGQHRLLAVEKARLPVVALVVRGLSIEARDMIDVAVRKRSVRNIIEITDGIQVSGLKVAWMSAAEHILTAGQFTSHFMLSVTGLREATEKHGDAVEVLATVASSAPVKAPRAARTGR